MLRRRCLRLNIRYLRSRSFALGALGGGQPSALKTLTLAPAANRSQMLGLEQSLGTLALTGAPSPLALPWNTTPSVASSSRMSTPLPGEVSPAGAKAAVVDVRFVELEARVAELEQSTQETDAKVVGLSYKVDDLTGVVAAQEDNFNKRLADVLASVREQQAQNNSLVAELCAKVQSQEEQLQQLLQRHRGHHVSR